MPSKKKVVHRSTFDTFSSSIAYPNFIQLGKNLFVAQFSLMKLLPAKYVIEKALNEGLVEKDGTVVETSSGTYALGMAIICLELKLKARVFSDPVIDEGLKEQLKHLGCELEIINRSDKSFQAARLEALKKYLTLHPHSFWPKQYDNPDHLHAYRSFSKAILNNFGDQINIVASVGSGSSSCGTIMGLREINPNIKLFGVDTFSSVLFGLKDGPRCLRGLGNSVVPKNLKHELFDEVHWIDAFLAFHKTIDFYSKTAIFSGPTSGACYLVASYLAQNFPEETFLFIAADSGHRYIQSVYQKASHFNQGLASSPYRVCHLSEVDQVKSSWACLSWNRRSLKEMEIT